MNMKLIRRKVMQYRGHEAEYVSESGDPEAEFVEQQHEKKQYRRKRSIRATRRRRSKAGGSRPSCGMGARRNKRWTW